AAATGSGRVTESAVICEYLDGTIESQPASEGVVCSPNGSPPVTPQLPQPLLHRLATEADVPVRLAVQAVAGLLHMLGNRGPAGLTGRSQRRELAPHDAVFLSHQRIGPGAGQAQPRPARQAAMRL